MVDRDHDQHRELDAAIRRLARSTPAESAAREAMEHVNDPALAADMDAVHVPMNKLLKAAGMVETEEDPEPSRSWFEAFCRWMWSPRVAYAVAAVAIVGAMFLGRGPESEPWSPQVVALAEFLPTRGVDDELPEVVIDRGVETVDLMVERSIDPDPGIRLRAILSEIDGDVELTVDFTSDSRLSANAPDRGFYPVYRVPNYLLRPGKIYRLSFIPVDAGGEPLDGAEFSSMFRVAG